MSDIPSHQRLFAELKHRRVFRVMTVYGIVGFIVLRVVNLALPALLLPQELSLNPTTTGAHYEIGLSLLLAGQPEAALEEAAAEPDDEYRVKLTALALY